MTEGMIYAIRKSYVEADVAMEIECAYNKMKEAIARYLVANGPCENVDVDESLCDDKGCEYCELERALQNAEAKERRLMGL
jgi:hypothetical protein